MKPLRVALITRAGSVPGQRLPGMWSYAVPEFTVTHYPVGKGFTLSRDELARRHDVIVYEDGKTWGQLIGSTRIPVCYLVTDSTLSDEHFRIRLEQASQADLVLVDWDRLDRFAGTGKPVRRLSYCVNDMMFHDWGQEKTADIACHLHTKGSPERARMVEWLEAFSDARGYRYAGGIRYGSDYALSMNRARVVVDLARNKATRNHRTLDAMASMTCLLTSPLPEVEGEDHGEAGVHYLEWRNRDLGRQIDWALEGQKWGLIAGAAYVLAHCHHIWRVRAAELREILGEVFPKLGKGGTGMKQIDLVELQSQGFLQEANRLFFHPLGLCLTIVFQVAEDGSRHDGVLTIQDARDDPEGFLFAQANLPEKDKADRVETVRREKAAVRTERFGFEIQPASE